jgi:hypothetical protein
VYLIYKDSLVNKDVEEVQMIPFYNIYQIVGMEI